MKETEMECTGFDWKGYALGELGAAESLECDRHAQSCQRCRMDLARYRATVASLRSLPMVEPPQRIVFTPQPAGSAASWWQRLWFSSPQLGFASAAILALAIVAHGVLSRGVGSPTPTAAVQQTLLDSRIHLEAQAELKRALPQALDAALSTGMQTKIREQLSPAFASFQRQLSQQEQIHTAAIEQRRDSDQRAVRYAFDKLERKVNYSLLSTSARPQVGE